MKWLIWITMVGGMLLLFPGIAPAGGCLPSWDDEFKKAARTFFPAGLKHRWRTLQKQAVVESSCRPMVCSTAGACGLLQIMPATWEHLTGRPPDQSIFHPKQNIIVAAKYMGWQTRQWMARGRTNNEILELAWASYNAGLGNVLAAQRRCGGVRLWPEIEPCLPDVTGRHATETIQYVDRIQEQLRCSEFSVGSNYLRCWASSSRPLAH